MQNASNDDVRSQQRGEEILAVLLRPHIIGCSHDSDSDKKAKKADFTHSGERSAGFATVKIGLNWGKLYATSP